MSEDKTKDKKSAITIREKRISVKLIAALCAAVIIIIGGLWAHLSYAPVISGLSVKFIPTDVTELDLSGMNITDMSAITRCDRLVSLDLREAQFDEDQCEDIANALPRCVILRSVVIGGVEYSSDAAKVDVSAAAEEELSLLRYFPSLESVEAQGCEHYDKLIEMSEAMPHCDFRWTVDICGTAAQNDATELIIEGGDFDSDELVSKVYALPKLSVIDLRKIELSPGEISSLRSSLSQYEIYWSAKFYGRRISSTDEEIDLSGIKIEDISQLDTMLSLLPHPKKINMCGCGLTNDRMEELCEKYTDFKFVWEIRLGIWSLRTDATYFCTNISSKDTPRLKNRDIVPLKYCTDLEHLDLGHNPITDLSPLEGLTKLKTLIVIGSTVKDISPLAGMTEMEYLELFINDISDLTPLSNMHKLLDLNLCYNEIEDVTPLLGLTQLERLWISCNLLTEEDEQALMEALPNCQFNFTALASTGGGWRRHERYFDMRENFGYEPDREEFGF